MASQQMRRQNWNILLLVDNALTHALYETTYLTNITIKYLLSSITSHLQSCDQGIINSFKSQYQKLYLRNRIKLLISFMNLVSNLWKLTLINVGNHNHCRLIKFVSFKHDYWLLDFIFGLCLDKFWNWFSSMKNLLS